MDHKMNQSKFPLWLLWLACSLTCFSDFLFNLAWQHLVFSGLCNAVPGKHAHVWWLTTANPRYPSNILNYHSLKFKTGFTPPLQKFLKAWIIHLAKCVNIEPRFKNTLNSPPPPHFNITLVTPQCFSWTPLQKCVWTQGPLTDMDTIK